jgi:hypothetical protein
VSGASDATEPAEPPPPAPAVLRVIKGHPTDEELAAVVTVLALSAGRAPTGTRAAAGTGQWSAYWRGVGAPMPAGPDAWRRSARP